MAAYQMSASDLAEKAALAALEESAIPRDRVSHIVLVTCSGFDAPGVDVALIQRLGLRPTTSRTSVGFMGCHGAINGMRVAKAFCDADPAAVVLLVAVELCSLHYQYDWTPERIIANALFSDGAAAAVISAGPSDGPRIASTFSEIIPDSQDAMSWKIGDHGFTMTLAPRVPELIESSTRAPIELWLAGEGLSLSDVADWAVHPGGPRILDAAGTALGLLLADLDAVEGLVSSSDLGRGWLLKRRCWFDSLRTLASSTATVNESDGLESVRSAVVSIELEVLSAYRRRTPPM
ncbi:unnamed protein product [Symbiodinium sp. CCMP2456]|nr:unnamed protein product [Symbiodinium sp. CCMP2456]